MSNASTTFTGNSTFGPFVVSPIVSSASTEANGKDATAEVITFQFAGDWNSATVTIQVCCSPGSSPQVWAPVSDGAFTADVAKNIVLSTGVWFRVVSSGSGSPIPNIKAALCGQFSNAG